jgi:phosphoribosylaminoimidazolecarboxamide formyltransferase/IMP cyclohydrolase
VIAANRVVTEKMALQVAEIFTEVIAAPGFEPAALEVLSKKKNLRILELANGYVRPAREIRQVSGGALIQDSDGFENLDTSKWQLVTGNAADSALLADLEFAWRASRGVKSNAILLAKDLAAVGIGMGQVNRLDSCRLAVSRAGDRVVGSVAASDAFFPFADGLQVLIDAGVKAVVQPGGSVRDEEVIAAAKAAGITMYFTSERHFYH